MKRILVISPSGEVYDHDNVRWYNHANVQANIDHYHNIGDAFVFDSSLKLLNFSKLEPLKIRTPTDADIDEAMRIAQQFLRRHWQRRPVLMRGAALGAGFLWLLWNR